MQINSVGYAAQKIGNQPVINRTDGPKKKEEPTALNGSKEKKSENIFYHNNKPVTLEEAIKIVSENGDELRNMSENAKDNKDIALAAANQSYLAIEFMSGRLRNNKQIVISTVKQFGMMLRLASPALRNDKETVLSAIQEDSSSLQFASQSLQNDKEIVFAAIKNGGIIGSPSIQFASSALQNDKETILYAVERNWESLKYASSTLQNDKEIVMAAINNSYRALQFASAKLQDDKEFVLPIVANYSDAFRYISPNLKNNKEIVLIITKINHRILSYIDPDLFKDKEFMLAAIAQNWNALEYASDELRRNKELVTAATKQNIAALRYASNDLLDDKEFMLAAIALDANALEYASSYFKNDKDIVLVAVKKDRTALKYASPDLQKDWDINLASTKFVFDFNDLALRFSVANKYNFADINVLSGYLAERDDWLNDFLPIGGTMQTSVYKNYDWTSKFEIELESPSIKIGLDKTIGVSLNYQFEDDLAYKYVDWWNFVKLNSFAIKRNTPGIGISWRDKFMKYQIGIQGIEYIRREFAGIDVYGGVNKSREIGYTSLGHSVAARADVRCVLGPVDFGISYEKAGAVDQVSFGIGFTLGAK